MQTPGIRAKLAMAFVLVSAMTAIGMLVVVQWSFDRGFLKYINTQNLKMLEQMSTSVMGYYQPVGADGEGGWSRLVRQPHLWRDLLERIQPDTTDRKRRFPPVNPQESGQFPDASFPGSPPVPPPGASPGRYPPQPMGGPKILLYDENHRVLLGPDIPADNVLFQPLKFNNQIVGFLGMVQDKFVADRLDLRFLDTQRRSFIVIALLMLLPALFFSLPLARRLVRPLRKLIKATRQLSAGDYEARIEVDNRDELGELADHFNHLARTLKANDRDRKQWVADISHELRTPLSVLKGQIEALQDGIYTPTDKHFQMLHDRVGQLSGLVDDLYELSLTDAGALSYHPENVAIKCFLEDIVDGFREAFSKVELEVNTDIHLSEKDMLFADEKRLRQLLTNLMNNSIRYTDAGGIVKISAGVEGERKHAKKDAKRPGKSLFIVIEDSAPGVSDEQIPYIFDRLYRVESSRNRANGGAGLGLSICRNIVQAHGGSITAADSELGGLKITLSFPYS